MAGTARLAAEAGSGLELEGEGVLSLGCPFCILAVCGVLYSGISSLCVGLYRWLVKVSWLGKLVSVLVLDASICPLVSSVVKPMCFPGDDGDSGAGALLSGCISL